MDDFQTAMYMFMWFMTCGFVGFLCGIYAAKPVKEEVAKQLRDDILNELRKQNQENAKNVGGFRIVSGGRNPV